VDVAAAGPLAAGGDVDRVEVKDRRVRHHLDDAGGGAGPVRQERLDGPGDRRQVVAEPGAQRARGRGLGAQVPQVHARQRITSRKFMPVVDYCRSIAIAAFANRVLYKHVDR
jgi:hypothetical protein